MKPKPGQRYIRNDIYNENIAVIEVLSSNWGVVRQIIKGSYVIGQKADWGFHNVNGITYIYLEGQDAPEKGFQNGN